MPRRPQSPDPAVATGKGKDKGKDKGKKDGKGGDAVDTPVPNMDLDDKLIYDAHQAGLAAVDKIVRLFTSIYRGFHSSCTFYYF